MINSAVPFSRYFRALDECRVTRWAGRVVKATESVVESEGPVCSIGARCEIVNTSGMSAEAEVVAFRGPLVVSVPLRRMDHLHYGDLVVSSGEKPVMRVGEGLLGHVLDALGNQLDSGIIGGCRERWLLRNQGPAALDRSPIVEPLGTGIRAVDAFLTCGRGQRMGIFGGSGVGKSTLIGMMTRGSAADVTVLALVGERGREVRQYLDEALGEEGRTKSVVVVSTSDESPLLRVRAALAATSVAEYFRSRGKHVLLVVDSLTRFAMAQREIGLAAGEPPTSKGYTPSVFTAMAQLIERAGHVDGGSITAFYTVLMEGDDQQDPIADAARSLLDGHIVLDRRLAAQNHYPPINVLDSLSRLMPAVCSREHLEKAGRLRRMLAAYTAAEDLIRVGAYQKNLDPVLDQALAALPSVNEFLRQSPDEHAALDETLSRLMALPG